ncbi:MAG: NUDIX hydrolase [Xenococcaceae cyanobacterium MO_207.B15]|nr:NUDIX hydrolase [Xenococcaceae cyanobacterium MO_207.B15]MDJ0743883.1 NUDIX hydrolase [Xenococcaceae cyanobacterium MO_167.B27]
MSLKPTVSMAILYREGKFLMQLRDDVPGILYPGHWGLFGGHLESDETPEDGLVREVQEEINYLVSQPQKFRCYADNRAVRYIFYAPLTVETQSLQQMEGWDLDLVPPQDIIKGTYYSDKAKEERPLGDIHQRILLDFIESGLVDSRY